MNNVFLVRQGSSDECSIFVDCLKQGDSLISGKVLILHGYGADGEIITDVVILSNDFIIQAYKSIPL